jgi:glycosyltransferase involved in cell wall biosynthesis
LQISLLRRRIGFYYIIDQHKSGSLNENIGLKFLFSLYKLYITYLNYNTANLIVTFAKDQTDNLLARFKSFAPKVKTQFAGVSIENFFFNQNDRETIRKSLSIDNKEFVGIVSGRIEESKEIHCLIQELAESGVEMKLIIIGKLNDIYKRKLRDLSSTLFADTKTVSFIDRVPNSELRKYYCAADVGFWVSHISIGILEAYACNLPVILCRSATNCYPPITPELVVNDRDFHAALSKIRSLFTNDNNINNFRIKARQLAQNFSYTLLAKNILKYTNIETQQY